MAGATRAAGRELAERLAERREEIEQTLLTRVYAVSDPREVGDPEYVLGLREAVSVALDYCLRVLADGEAHTGQVPPGLLHQARQAARHGVSLDTVLRRYFGGYTLLCDCLMRETESGGALEGAPLRELFRAQSALFDRLVAAVTDAYSSEAENRHTTAEHRLAIGVKRLLEGELTDASEFDYPLEAWHVGIVASGPGTPGALRGLAGHLGCRLLLVRVGGEVVWGWLGSRHPLRPDRFGDAAEKVLTPAIALAAGETARGLGGWRATHRQAAAALPVAQRTGRGPVRYADVALLAASLRDEVLADSLRELYLAPLLEERDGGEALRRTARAYFAAGRNVSAAAAALRVSRTTVAARLRTIEERIGRPPEECAAQIETALRLQDLQPLTRGASAG